MSFANRTFRDNKTGEIVKVIDSFEKIAILENKSKISTDFLSNPELYTEEINPLNFFNNQAPLNNFLIKYISLFQILYDFIYLI